MSYQGQLGYQVSTKGIIEGTVVTPGFKQSGNGVSNYEAMSLYFANDAGGFDIEPNAWDGGRKEKIAYGIHKLTGKYDLLGTDLAVFSNLCKQSLGVTGAAGRLAGTVNFFGTNEDGEKLSLVALPTLTDYIGTPACSTMGGLTLNDTEWQCEEQKRGLTLVLNGAVTDAMVQYANSSKAAYIATGAGVSSGATCSLVQITSSRALRVLPSGFYSFQFTPTGGAVSDVGILDQCSMSLKLVGSPYQFNNQRAQYLQYTIKGRTQQGKFDQLAYASSASLLDGTFQLFSIAGESPSFVNARGTFKWHGMGNDQAYLELDATATAPLTQCDFTDPLAPVITANTM